MTKFINKLTTVCSIFAIVLCCFIGCKNNNNKTSPTADYYAKLGYHKVTYSSDITFDTNSDSIVIIDSTTFMAKPNTIITPLSVNHNNKQILITSDVQRETIDFENSTYLAGLNIDSDFITFSAATNGILVNKNISISLCYSNFKTIGVAFYNISDVNTNANNFYANPHYVQTLLTKHDNQLDSSDDHLLCVYQLGGLNHTNPSALKSNVAFKTNNFTSTNFELTIEIFLETKKMFSYLLLEDENQNYYLYNKAETSPPTSITFENSNYQFKINTTYDLTTEQP